MHDSTFMAATVVDTGRRFFSIEPSIIFGEKNLTYFLVKKPYIFKNFFKTTNDVKCHQHLKRDILNSRFKNQVKPTQKMVSNVTLYLIYEAHVLYSNDGVQCEPRSYQIWSFFCQVSTQRGRKRVWKANRKPLMQKNILRWQKKNWTRVGKFGNLSSLLGSLLWISQSNLLQYHHFLGYNRESYKKGLTYYSRSLGRLVHGGPICDGSMLSGTIYVCVHLKAILWYP